MSIKSYKHKEIPENPKIGPVKEALIVNVTLSASSGSKDWPNIIGLKMNGICQLTGKPSRPVETQISEYVRADPSARVRPITLGARTPHQSNFKATKMSLKCRKKSYLVFHLDDGLAWAFARNYYPLSASEDDESQGIRDCPFANQRLINNDGNFIMHGTDQAPVNGCRFAVMILDPSQLEDIDNFVARFNLHVELLEKPNDFSGPFIPITLDPDVRWPGGDGP